MIDAIGEPAVRTTTRTDNHLTVENKDVDLKKVEKAVEERPVEDARESTTQGSDSDKKSGSYNVDENGVFYEKYDKDGNVVYRIPPEQKPIDEHV